MGLEPDSTYCMLTIHYEPADENCGECHFSTGDPNADYHWAEKSRTTDIVTDLNVASGWYSVGGDPAVSAYHISYHNIDDDPPLTGDLSGDCDFLLSDPTQTFGPVPYDIDAANIEPTTGNYTAEYSFLSGPFVDQELWVGVIYYTGGGVFSGEVDHFKWDVWDTDSVSTTRNCSWTKTVYDPDIYGPECLYYEDFGQTYIEKERNRTLYSSPWFGGDGSWSKANGFARERHSAEGCFNFQLEYRSEYSFSDSPCGGYDREHRDIETLIGGGEEDFRSWVTTNKSKLIVN